MDGVLLEVGGSPLLSICFDCDFDLISNFKQIFIYLTNINVSPCHKVITSQQADGGDGEHDDKFSGTKSGTNSQVQHKTSAFLGLLSCWQAAVDSQIIVQLGKICHFRFQLLQRKGSHWNIFGEKKLLLYEAPSYKNIRIYFSIKVSLQCTSSSTAYGSSDVSIINNN